MTILVFIVVIIGGLGSVTGCFVGAVLVGLVANYVGFLVADAGARLQYRADGGGAAVAAARPVSGGAAMKTRGIGLRLISGDRPGHPIATALVHRAVRCTRAGAVRVSPAPARWRSRSRIAIFIVLAGELRHAARLYRHRLVRAHDVLRHRRLRVAIPLARGWVGWDAMLLRYRRGRGAGGADRRRHSAAFIARAPHLLLHDHAGGGSFAQILATQMRDLTGGEDGLTFSLPDVLARRSACSLRPCWACASTAGCSPITWFSLSRSCCSCSCCAR